MIALFVVLKAHYDVPDAELHCRDPIIIGVVVDIAESYFGSIA